MNPILEAKNLYFSYENTWALENIHFNIYPNTLNTFIGPNGGGKTTLIKLILGLLKPTQGIIKIRTNDTENLSSRFGYVPQHIIFDPLFPITVEEIVLMGRLKPKKFFQKYSPSDYESVKVALKKVQLEDVLKEPFRNLSGGQKQRILIARALASDPIFLILDEPTANIDPIFEIEFLKILNELKHKMTILLISHQLGTIGPITDQILCVNRTLHTHNGKFLSKNLIESLYNQKITTLHKSSIE
jgi:zinc transport system ATP-binding protein